jgi:hypothetical protein
MVVGNCSFGDKAAGTLTDQSRPFNSKARNAGSGIIPSKIGGVMLIKGEITLPFTEIFERQTEVHYILQVWYR